MSLQGSPLQASADKPCMQDRYPSSSGTLQYIDMKCMHPPEDCCRTGFLDLRPLSHGGVVPCRSMHVTKGRQRCRLASTAQSCHVQAPVTPLPTLSFFTSTEERFRLLAKMAPCSSAPLAPTCTTVILQALTKKVVCHEAISLASGGPSSSPPRLLRLASHSTVHHAAVEQV